MLRKQSFELFFMLWSKQTQYFITASDTMLHMLPHYPYNYG